MIDFSSKHDIWIRNQDGSLSRMDEPYFLPEKIAPGTWRIISSGDSSYLLEGDDEALAIDSGYGAGNIREFMQTLTDKPVRRIANTHHHFDHTAMNSYFEMAYMSEKAVPLATIPFPSFSGMDFPRDYPITVVPDGGVIPLKGRDLLALSLPDHAESSMVFLDRKARILYTGDEFMPMGKRLNGGLKSWYEGLEKIDKYREEFDMLYGGAFVMKAAFFDACLVCAKYAMEQPDLGPSNGGPKGPPPGMMQKDPNETRTIYDRMAPHPEDKGGSEPIAPENLRRVEYAGTSISFDITKKFQ
ncbi:MAG: MBL fold metallo-hydrolase [Oscillospiraceae bacterium]|nr:MBL fold metallo-hydrolase [Oscillospiraceae bacterium]